VINKGSHRFDRLLIALAVGLSAGCSPTPSCDEVCAAARPVFEGCLDERGLTWGDGVGYADAEDYDLWCDTWIGEQRLLAQTAVDAGGAQTALERRCVEQIRALEGDDCAVYDGLWQ
jgi:hypothetical protein